jgi:class 3 adenylate cyclase
VGRRAIDANEGIIDKFVGDGIMAPFIPVIAGENHAGRAINAGREIPAAVERDGLARKGLMVRAGRPQRRGLRGRRGVTRRSISPP